MFHCFVPSLPEGAGEVLIRGEDVNHIRNVLRMKPGEELLVSDGFGRDVLCEIAEIRKDEILARIRPEAVAGTELPVFVTLYQGLPKSDKMEWIIQKCVELGVSRIVPVETARCVVRLDAKKAASRQERWQKIAESAAKQSRRSRIPEIGPMMSLPRALEDSKDCGIRVIPYENCEGPETLREMFSALRKCAGEPGAAAAVYIGPEGGFELAEVEQARESGVTPITLGRRILRTETAGMALLAAMMLQLETGESYEKKQC